MKKEVMGSKNPISTVSRFQSETRSLHPSLLSDSGVYEQFLDFTQCAVWIVDFEGITTYVNSSLANMLGYSREEILGKHSFSFLDGSRKVIAQERLELRRKGIAGTGKGYLKHKSGRDVLVISSSNPLADRDGQIIGVVAFLCEIDTERTVQEKITCGNLLLDLESLEVIVNQKPIKFTAFRFKLLKYFLENKNRLISRKELLEKVWDSKKYRKSSH